MKKQSIWVFQWRKSVHYWWRYILFSPECKELTSMLDPLLYRWGVPPVVIRCLHWTMQMWVLQTWIKALGLYIVMLKPFIARDFMEGHICRQNTPMFALVFCFELRARAARTCCHCHLQAAVKTPIHDGKRGQLKLPKKVMNGTTMWSCDTELCTNGVEATKCWVFVAHFSIYSTSRCRCHSGTDIPRLRGHTLQINQVVRTVRHRISCCAPTIHWKCDA